MEFLDRVGCPLDVRNHSGHGILHKAAQRGNTQLCQWWIQEKLWGWVQNYNSIAEEKEVDRSQCEKNIQRKRYVWRHVLDLIGPDNDGCVASDLAGMEQFEDLAQYLAQQEVELVHSILEQLFDWDASHSEDSHTRLPDWLMEGVRCPMIVATKNSNQEERSPHKMHWGSWEGVYRMRSVLTQERFRRAHFATNRV
jgi:hypothetical protein